MPRIDEWVYIGDAVYVKHDGYGMWLHTDSHLEHEARNKIYLEEAVYENLVNFYNGVIKENPK